MPFHTPAERKKNRNNPGRDRGTIQRARDLITEGIGGFSTREAREATQRSTVAQPFTGAPGQRERRRALIGRGARTQATPIIKKKKKTQAGNIPGSLSDIEKRRKERERAFAEALR